MYTKGDFHMHSTFSDGDYSPKELIILSKEAGLDILAITDHNKIDAFKEAYDYGKKNNIRVIPGIEISCRYKDFKVHVLGYFKDNIIYNDEFHKILTHIKKKNFKTISLINPSINILPDTHSNKISVKSAIDFINFFGGISILAHPIKLPFGIFNELMTLNFNGIEAKYFKNTLSDTNFFIDICTKKNLIYTAGSDFHTDKKEDKRHGKIGDVYLTSSEISLLLSLL